MTVKKQKQAAYLGSVLDNQKSMAVAWEQVKIRTSASSGAKRGAVDLSCDDDDEDVRKGCMSGLLEAVGVWTGRTKLGCFETCQIW